MTSATITETAEFPRRSVFAEKLAQLRLLLSERLVCEHDELVFDDINDVHCKHCGEDFTD